MKKIPVYLAATAMAFFAACNSSKTGSASNEMKLFAIKNGNMQGYVNREGKIVINPQFADAGFFSDGIALVQTQGGQYGYIDETGKFLVNPQFADASPFYEGLAATVMVDSPVNYIDPSGTVKIRLPFADQAGMFSGGLAPFRQAGKIGYIDKSGMVVITPQFDKAGYFSDDRAPVATYDKDGQLKWGFIDKKGELKIPYRFVSASSFSEGLAEVSAGAHYGYIDKEGKFVIDPAFDKVDLFYNGMARIIMSGKFGFIDKTGKVVVEPQFAYVSSFSANGLAAAAIGEGNDLRYGYIDKKGAWVINPQFPAASDFSGNTAFAGTSATSFGIINEKGVYKVNPQFEVMPFVYNSNSSVTIANNSLVSARTGTPWQVANQWLNGFYHMNYASAFAVSNDVTKEFIAGCAERLPTASQSTIAVWKSTQVRIKSIQTEGDQGLVIYTISMLPDKDLSLHMLRANGKWLAGFSTDDFANANAVMQSAINAAAAQP